MIKEAFGVADTIEEAIELAKEELGAGIDADVNYEIIETPKKKVMGLFGGTQAKVRAYVELPDKKEVKKETKKPAPKKEKENKVSAKETKAEPKEETLETISEDALEVGTPAYKAVQYLKPILSGLGCSDITVKVALKENGAKIILNGEGLGGCIGRRGETLDSLQYLASMVASIGGYYRISLDVGNYREKRERTLVSLANRISAQVKKTGRSRSLEPMNPYERRIIHTAVQEIEGVVSNSRGEGDRRHVVISPEGGEKPAKSAPAEPRERKTDSAALPLYGKIK